MRKEGTHAPARIAATVCITLAALTFSAPALAHKRSNRHGSSACHRHACHSHSTHHVTHHPKPAHPRTHPAPAAAHHKAEPTTPSPAAVIANVLATPCQNTTVTPEAANIAEVRSSVLCLINRVRAEHGEEPLATNADLERAAEEHSQELIADDYFAHVSPSGLTPVQRIDATGYVPGPSFGYVLGENLAWGTLSLSTPQAIVNAWVASPGHLANILESQYKDTGIGVVASVPSSLGGGQQGATYAQEFGVILS